MLGAGYLLLLPVWSLCAFFTFDRTQVVFFFSFFQVYLSA